MGSFVTAIAVFDLDGTVTRRDTFVPYLRGWLRRHPARRRRLAILAAVIRYLATGRDRGRLKCELLRACMGGAGRAEVDAWSDEFVAGLDAAMLCPRHQQAGARLAQDVSDLSGAGPRPHPDTNESCLFAANVRHVR